jgi:hypothetical protein
VVVPTVNSKQLSIACESGDNHADGRSPQVDLVRRGRAVAIARSLAPRAWWRWKSRPRGGRPRTPDEIRQLIREMSVANPLWGAPRIHGELLKLGMDVPDHRGEVHGTADESTHERSQGKCHRDRFPEPRSSSSRISSGPPFHSGTIAGLPRGNLASVSVLKFSVWATSSGGVRVIQSDRETSMNCGALNTSRTSRSVLPVFLM